METDTTSSPPPAPISWQTALWTIIPLLLNTWGQPTGRILILCPKHSIFPRSYPFHALFDLLSITLSLLYSIFYLGLSPRLAIDLLVYYRYDDCDEDSGLKALRKWRWLRWAMFALGGAQPAFKLAAFRGLPITKAVGMTWTASWVVLEILGLLARDVDLGTEGEGPLTLRQHRALVASRKMKPANGSLYILFLDSLIPVMRLMSCSICFFVIQDVLYGKHHRLSVELILLEIGGLVLGYGTASFADKWRIQWTKYRFPSWEIARHIFRLICGGLIFSALFKVLASRIGGQDTFLIIGLLALLIGCFTIQSACERPLARRIFAFDEANCSVDCVNRSSAGTIWLLINITFVILWYAYRYRSEGTYNPGWTSVFG